MPFSSEETARALLELQTLTGETQAEAVKKAVQERLLRERARCFQIEDPLMGMEEIWERLRLIPKRDPRTDEEIIGYGQDGLPA